ncbi:hypothetical protein J1N35_011061 [Gossypium stocksii]|uniref:Uncharacterized protein n=1 Tax=Gossypium stocksii TaxID=47602 RepID=A0A9D4ACU9_9ROSI|nr:hypothetical protein J1N35_011061 [Gossypium stocksii]
MEESIRTPNKEKSDLIYDDDNNKGSNFLCSSESLGKLSQDASSLQSLQEIVKLPTTGILDAAKHSVVLFKENTQATNEGLVHKNRNKANEHQADFPTTCVIMKVGNSRKGRNLKVNKEKGNSFKASPSISISDSISNMVELLQSQVQQGLVNEVPKRIVGKVGDKAENRL